MNWLTVWRCYKRRKPNIRASIKYQEFDVLMQRMEELQARVRGMMK